MVSPIQRLTVPEFAGLLAATKATLTRQIDSVHLHHTWRPRRADFRGLATVEAMRRFHMGQGWSDIAQHLTIDPFGVLWTGRNWNAPPASNTGSNGSPQHGPFMIEMVGDFDLHADVLDGSQRDAVVQVVARLLSAFGLTSSKLMFHRELGSPKTCPGSGVDKAALVSEVDAAMTDLKTARPRGARAASPAAPFSRATLIGFDVTEPWVGEKEDRTVPEHGAAADSIEELARAAASPRFVSGSGVVTREVDEWAMLRPHVINLTRGRFSDTGIFKMKPGAIEGIKDSIREYVATSVTPRLMIHAHGGLVQERSALLYAQSSIPWWTDQGIYPIYFVWETGAFDVILQRLGIRGLGDAQDRVFEAFARRAAAWAWSDMKESARLASTSDMGHGDPGGALVFAHELKALLASLPAGKTLAINAVGHSAGAIFHAHFLPELARLGVALDSLSLLAPAVRNDVFATNVSPLIGSAIARLLMCTMTEDAEREDDLIKPLGVPVYGKSLLYLVSRAFEPKRKTPVVGLEETLRQDSSLLALFTDPPGRLELSPAKGQPPNPNTKAKRHGCFDNDPATLRTVAGFIRNDSTFPATPFPSDEACEKADQERRLMIDLTRAMQESPARSPVVGSRSAGRRNALCIGIDHYPTNPLAGCVHDAQSWSAELRGLGFTVTMLLDRDATRSRIVSALTNLVTSAAPGDELVFQYAGHGTQVADLNGDESDRFDEAFVPVDYESGALLLDDDLGEIYRQLPSGAVLTLFMDCCHSGTNSRFAPRDLKRARPGELRRFLPMTSSLEQAHRAFRSRMSAPPPTSSDQSFEGIVHIAACRDDQFAYEIDGSGNFTRTATPALRDAVARRETNESFAERIGRAVEALGNPQTPQLMRLPTSLEGRPLLAATDRAVAAESSTPVAALNANDRVAYHLSEALRLLGERQ